MFFQILGEAQPCPAFCGTGILTQWGGDTCINTDEYEWLILYYNIWIIYVIINVFLSYNIIYLC